MSIRWRRGRPIVEVYDPAAKGKRHVRAAEFDLEPPPSGASRRTLERFARRLETAALSEIAAQRARLIDETVASFAQRWPTDYHGHTEKGRSEATRKTNRQAVRLFARADQFGDRLMRSITKPEGRKFAQAHPSHAPALRAMFNDAIEDGIADANPFAALGQAQSRGRADIIVLTEEEVDELAATALEVHGDEFGAEVAAMIRWGAYTCCRAGETFAARYSRLAGDVYDVREQFNSNLRRETEPKHGGVGLIFVAEPARRAVLEKPRRLGDDLMFRTVRGQQFRRESWHYTWDPVRVAFTAKLPKSHPLRQRLKADPRDKLDFHELRHFGASYMLNELGIEPWVIAEQLRQKDGGKLVIELYGHPQRREAIERIRRAYGSNVRDLRDAGNVPKANGESSA